MYAFKIMTAPPGFFMGGYDHDDEEDLIMEESEEIEDLFDEVQEIQEEFPEDLFGGGIRIAEDEWNMDGLEFSE
jgi:hypothetical protein